MSEEALNTNPELPLVENSSEAPQAEAPVIAEKKEDSFSRQFTILSKKERAVQRLESEMKLREKQLLEREKALQEAEKDPYGWLEKKGHTYQDWTKRILNDGKPTPEMEIKTVKQELEERVKKQEEELNRIKDDYNKTQINNFRNNLKDFIQTKEDYEFIRENGADGFETVYQLIVEDINRQQAEGIENDDVKVMTFEDACSRVENHLFEEAKKLTKLKKVQGLLGQISSKEKDSEPEVTPSQKVTETILSKVGHTSQRPNTLTNQMETSIPNSREKRQMTREERVREAAKHIVWK